MLQQPNFNIKDNAVIDDLESLSSEELKKLVGGVGQLLNKRPGQLGQLKQAPTVKYTDLTQYLGGLNER